MLSIFSKYFTWPSSSSYPDYIISPVSASYHELRSTTRSIVTVVKELVLKDV